MVGDLVIRRVRESDLDSILQLNFAAENVVGKAGREFFERYWGSRFFNVAERDSQVMGFLMALSDSDNCDYAGFKWFKSKYDSFFYIDRVVVAPEVQRNGVGRALYDDLITKRYTTPLVSEVIIRPMNNKSVRFHRKLGFKYVGKYVSADSELLGMYKLDEVKVDG